MQVGGDHTKIIASLINIRNSYWDTIQKLMTRYSWKEGDARIGVFAKCMNNFEPIMYSLMFEQEYLRKPSYQARFSKDHKTPPTEQEQKNICEFYLRYMQMAFCDIFFSAVESSFRIFVRTLDPTICDNATGAFFTIQKYLLEKTNQKKYESLMNLWRLIRNTQHNNGFYMDPKYPKIDINYAGIKYQFVDKTFFYSVDMDLLLKLSSDVRDMLQNIVESPILSSRETIIDPTYAALNFHKPSPDI